MMKIHLLFLFLLCSGIGYGQESYVYFNWDVNTPLTNKEWIDNTSLRGARAGFRKFIGVERKFSAGLDINWSYFDDYKPTETFQNPNGAITTDYFNNIFQMGAAVSSQYHFKVTNAEYLFPYVGLGLGAARNTYSVSYNIYKDEENSWGMLARPEAGILVRIGTRRKLGLMAAVHYDYSTAKSNDYGYNNFSTVGFQLGIMSMQW